MTDLERQLLAVAEERKIKATLKEKKYDESSKAQLLKIIETKLKTSFIAPLDYFENAFGILWGHGKSVSQLTNEERKFREIWNDIRNDVLNNGNNQIRAVKNELEQYSVTWNRYKVNFLVQQEKDN